jgi:hypothetical protein
MNKLQRCWLTASILIIISSFSLVAQARILSVQATNSPSQLGLTTNARSQISWAVVEEPNAIGQAQISSSEGLFFDPEQKTMLGRSSRLLTQTRALIGEMNTTFIFQESLIIPQSVLRTAQDRGLNQIIYVRTFQDNPGATTMAGSVTFSISASGNVGYVNLRQIQMEFDDGRTSAIMPTSSQLKANAIVSYQGTGIIQYRWEIASPPTTNGQPIFAPLMTRREYLMSSGQTTLSSPNLPTTIVGAYLLRLNITQPEAQFEMPILRYFVQSNNDSASVIVQKMKILLPPENVKLTLATEFSWQAVQDAKAYQIEFYSHINRQQLLPTSDQDKPITGAIVPASQTSLTMGRISTGHLQTGATYFWRMIAISDKGQKIAASEFRSINF